MLLLAAIAWTLLQHIIIVAQGPSSVLAAAVGDDTKGRLSALLYVIAIPLAFLHRWLADAVYVIVALMWLVPDWRIEAHATETHVG